MFNGKWSALLSCLYTRHTELKKKISSEVYNLYGNAKVSFSGSLKEITRFLLEGREGVKWELGFAFFRGWEMGFCALGLGFMKKKQ